MTGVIPRLSFVLAALLVAETVAAAPGWGGFSPLPPPGGFVSSHAYSVDMINQQVVGYGAVDPSDGGYTSALLWPFGSDVIDLAPSGFTNSVALGVYGGQQVGYGSSSTGTQHALLWSGTGSSAIDLTPSEWMNAEAVAVFSGQPGIWIGQQVGFGMAPADVGPSGSHVHALLWNGTPDSFVDLHPGPWNAPTYTDTYCTAIGGGPVYAQSQQVGYGDTADGHTHALLWSSSAGSAVDLHPGGFTDTRATGASGSQQVGYGVASDGSIHPLLWYGSAGSVVDLLPPGFSNARCTGTNGTYQVGYADNGGSPHAIVWTGSAASAIDLQFFFFALDYQSSHAYGIAAGDEIAGDATDSNGNTVAGVWLPGPSSFVSVPPLVKGRVGQTITLTGYDYSRMDASPVSGSPMDFYVQGTYLGTVLTGPDGIASTPYVIPVSLGPGKHAYAVGNDEGVSGTGWIQVGQGNTAFSLYAASGAPGKTVNLRTLMLCGGTPIIGRTVQFSVDSTPVGSAVSDISGASLAWKIPSSLASGTHNVTASFAGDACYLAASRTTPALTVKGTVAFSVYAASGSPGQTVTLKTLVYSGGAPLIGKTIQFSVDATVVGSAVSDAGGAALAYAIPSAMTAGLHNVTVSFAADAAYFSASRTTAALTVVIAKKNISFSIYPASGHPGQDVTLKTLVYSGGKPVSGLTIEFAVDGVSIASAVSDAIAASLTYTIPLSAATGPYNVTVSFGGDSIYRAATRTTAALTVK